MNSLEAFDKVLGVARDACRYHAMSDAINTVWGYPVNNIRKDLEMASLIKEFSKNISIGVDMVNEEECCGMVALNIRGLLITIYSTNEYDKVKALKELKEWLENDGIR